MVPMLFVADRAATAQPVWVLPALGVFALASGLYAFVNSRRLIAQQTKAREEAPGTMRRTLDQIAPATFNQRLLGYRVAAVLAVGIGIVFIGLGLGALLGGPK